MITSAATKRETPYVWVTWLTKLMSGEDSCQWARWFRIHYEGYEKMPSDFDSVGWNMRHTRLLNETANKWEDEGWSVKIEGENKFSMDWYLTDKTHLILGGKPDIVARRIDGDQITFNIIDCKTGKPRLSDRFQVLTYIYDQAPIFKAYIEYFYNRRLQAKADGNEAGSYMFKLMMNALYGKFGQNGRQ